MKIIQATYLATFLLLLAHSLNAQPEVGFAEVDREVNEVAGVATISLTKINENTENITVTIRALTFAEFEATGRPLPDELQGPLGDPAEHNEDRIDFCKPEDVDDERCPDGVSFTQTFTFPPSMGNDERTVQVPLHDDDINEANEGFFLVIDVEESGESGETVTLKREGVSQIRIRDADPIEIGFTQPEYDTLEREALVDDLVYITKNNLTTEQEIRILVDASPFTTTLNEDFSINSPMEFVINPEIEEFAVPFQLFEDEIPEGKENFQLDISNVMTFGGLTLNPSSTTVNIIDNDVLNIEFEQPSYTVKEGDGSVEVCVRVNNVPDDQMIQLEAFGTISTRNGTAAAEDGEYTHLETSFDIFDDVRRRCFNISIGDDNTTESDSFFTVDIVPDSFNPPNVNFPQLSVEVVIEDDDQVNECELGQDNCHSNALCVDTEDSFMCVCKPGSEGDGVNNCDDIDECSDPSLNNCHVNAVCTNTEGSYTCSCRTGFVGNGVTCNPRPNDGSCTRKRDCHARATCTNGRCVCHSGFQGNGLSCSDINECASGTHKCGSNSRCRNAHGTYYCRCNYGYVRGENKFTCKDRNECARGWWICGRYGLCTNTEGSYHCSCVRGYRRVANRCVAQRSVPVPRPAAVTQDTTPRSGSRSTGTTKSTKSRSSGTTKSTKSSSTGTKKSTGTTRSSSSSSSSSSSRRG